MRLGGREASGAQKGLTADAHGGVPALHYLQQYTEDYGIFTIRGCNEQALSWAG